MRVLLYNHSGCENRGCEAIVRSTSALLAQRGARTILTSGQKNSCSAGKELIKDLVETAGDKIEIMAGSGVDAKVIKAVGAYIGAPAFHMSGKVTLDSAMIYRKEGVNMGLPSISEFELWRTQESKIREARQVLDEMGQA